MGNYMAALIDIYRKITDEGLNMEELLLFLDSKISIIGEEIILMDETPDLVKNDFIKRLNEQIDE